MRRMDAARVVDDLNALFGRLGQDPDVNIGEIVEAAGRLLGGACALYNRLDAKSRSLCVWSGFNLPADLPAEDAPKGHICYEATIKGGDRPVVISDISKTLYAESDPYVARYGLESYLGYPVKSGNERLGSLCVVDVKRRDWGEDEVDLISSLAKAVSLEEERRSALEQLKADRALLGQAQKLAQVGGWDFDPETGKLGWTDETFRIHDLPPGYPPSLDEAERFVVAEDRPRFQAAFSRAVADGVPYDMELRMRTHRGELRWVRSIGEPVFEDGMVRRLVGSIQDITVHKSMLDSLKQAKEDAEAADRAKSVFLANMSHEVRTPLNGIIGQLQLLGLSDLAEEDQGRVESALQAGRSLLGMLTDLLDLSLIESGKVMLAEESIDINALLGNIADAFRMQLDMKGIDLRFSIDSRLPSGLWGDAVRLRQILFNLVGNAIKFTEHGGVTVDVSPVSRADGSVRVLFTVSDTGIGIPDHEVNEVFAPFKQSESHSGRSEGAGLGLGIVRRLAQIMQGAISVESEEGVGTSIHLSLPLRLRHEETKDAPAGAPDLQGLRLLIVEDTQDNLVPLQTFLTIKGAEVDTARMAAEGIEMCGRRDYDLVLMDIKLPDMSGWTPSGPCAVRDTPAPSWR